MTIYPLSLGFVQAYLIETPDGLVLVDCGMPHQEGTILRAIRQRGPKDLSLILITHAHIDHYGSAAAIKRLTGAPVAIHRDDAQAMASGKSPTHTRRRFLQAITSLMGRLTPLPPVQADILLEDGDRLDQFGLPGRVVHTPGHTPGSCCLMLEDQTGFVGDLISTNGEPHLQRLFIENEKQLRESYLRLRELKLEKAYAGHGQRSLSGEELRQLIDAELGSIRP